MEKEVKIRGGYRARVTTLINQVTFEVAKARPDTPILQSLREEILNVRKEINNLDGKILGEAEDVNKEISGASEYNVKVNTAINVIDKYAPSRVESIASSKSVKLPNVTLKRFDGNPLEWLDFFDLYKASIHDQMRVCTNFEFLCLSNFGLQL